MMTRLVKLTAVVVVVALVSGIAYATLDWQKTFNNLYKPQSGSQIKKAKCALCHLDNAGKKDLNAYGKLLKGKKVQASSLRSIERKDADRDKYTNIEEIKAGTLPGDPKSKPRNK
ncbi:MAG: hypothetical protein ACUVRS_10195 [Armatimonadota bacterium]